MESLACMGRSKKPGKYPPITNLSNFSITISEIGILYKKSNKRAALFHYKLANGGKLPKKLEPRTSLSALYEGEIPIYGSGIKAVYAKTECGRLKKGKSPILRKIDK